ncbi:DUF4062 domain-containing protein [Psychrobacter urativorans]|uniref:DUF4062 domain-containing protein n=1 Tax=Psychrobacter urativorans TaxID=45610 RepID=UPI00191A7D5D|nr:DUF4062 domain-containing protein [Psychrobacter urativorans]
MSNRRYHIHVVCAPSDQMLVLDRIALFFQTRAFLTYDVSSELPRAALYGRQCIEDCDYTLVVLGDSYGATHNTGVSQMHLSYLSAKAKLKPMLTLIKTHQENANVNPQLRDFMRLVEQQTTGVYYYASTTNIHQLLTYAYGDMIERYPALSWVRENSTDNIANNPANSSVSHSAPPSRTTTAYAKSVSTTAISPTSVKPAIIQPQENEVFDSLTKTLNLTDTFDFQYSAQAYEGGNLTDVTMDLSCTWQEILQALIKIPSAFSIYGLQSCINRLVTTKADYDIKQLMPNVHAVSRCQISQKDLLKLQRLLVTANWIQLTATGARASQELWKLTFYAKKILKTVNQPKSVNPS